MMGIDERPGIDGKEIIPVERHGVKLFQWHFVEENAPVIWRGPMLGKMLRISLQVQWGELDYLLLIYHLAQEM